jgi:hypothetical protein
MIVTDCPLSSMPDALEHRFSHRGHRNGADPRSNRDTFAAARLRIDNPR